MSLKLIEHFYNNGKKHLKYYVDTTNRLVVGRQYNWYNDDNNSLYSIYDNIISGIHGMRKNYYSNGELRSLASYTAGKCNGLYQAWYFNGKISAIYRYLNGHVTEISNFNDKGELVRSDRYVNGRAKPSYESAKKYIEQH